MYKDWSFVYSPHLSSLQILSLWNFVLPPAERYKILLSCRWSCTNMNWSAPFFSFQQFGEHICRNRCSMAYWHCLQFFHVQRTVAYSKCCWTQLFIACFLLYFYRLYCCSRAQAFDTESRTWRAKDLGMGNLCVFHVALDYFCRALLPQSLWHYLIESF